MEGKNKKECEVVMLSTPKAVFPNCIWLGRISKTLHLDQSYPKGEVDPIDDSMLPQHIYITSDEEIKEGDFWYNTITKEICIAKDKVFDNWRTYNEKEGYCKKIIATTDTSLMKEISCPDNIEGCEVYHSEILPQPSPEFIRVYVKAYNEGNKIEKVLVEYEEY